MAADNTNTPTSNLPSDFSKANFFDKPPEEQEKLLSAIETSANAIEQRYANPNWFNIAAGFLKPQLGGFMASLGSANQALGENLEKQRGSVLTAAEYRAQVALMRNQLDQKARANEALKQGLAAPGGLTSKTAGTIQALGGTPPAEVAQTLTTNEAGKRGELLGQTNSARAGAGQVAELGQSITPLVKSEQAKLPLIPGSTIPPDGTINPDVPKPKPAAFLGSEDEWNSKPLAAKNAFNSSLAETEKDVAVGSMTNYQKAAEAAQPRLDLYRGMRELATSPGMDKVFGILSGNDAVSLAGKALDEGRLSGRLASIQNLLVQANITDPDLRRRAAQLVKLINENKSMVGDTSGRTTDQQTALRGAANPSLENPQTAFVALTDTLAHTEAKNRDLFGILKSKKANGEGYNASSFTTEPAYKAYTKKFMDEHTNMLLNPPKTGTPSFYSPSSDQNAPSVSASAAPSNKATPTRSAPSGWAKQPDGSFKKVE